MFPTEADRAELQLPTLPPAVLALLGREAAPPRLVAHLTLVHDVCLRLLRQLKKTWPKLVFDGHSVAFGAATHDIGKARHPLELAEPGKLHEAEGERLLLEHGTSPALARFARTHGASEPLALPLEDLLVVVADTVWKAKRTKALDDAVAAAIGVQTGAPAWDVFMKLDGLLERIAASADDRLEWQGRFSVDGGSA